MKKTLIIFSIIFGILPLWSERVWSDRQISVLGRDVDSISLGGTSGGLKSDVGYVSENTALSSSKLRKAVLLNGSYMSSSAFSLALGYVHPSEYGIFGGLYDQVYNSDTGDFFFTVSPFFSKEISTFFEIGFKLNIDYYTDRQEAPSDDDILSFGINGDFSLIMHPEYTYEQGILVVEDLKITAAFRNLGLIPWRKGGEQIPSEAKAEVPFKVTDLMRAGVGLDFIKTEIDDGNFKIRAQTDLALIYPINVSYHLGVSSDFTFNSLAVQPTTFSVMFGYFYHPLLPELFPLTTGLNLALPVGDSKMEIKYGVVFNDKVSSLSDINHNFGFVIEFGAVDEESPEIQTDIYGDEGIINPEENLEEFQEFEEL